MYDLEKIRGELLDKRAQFHLSISTVLLGIFTFKIDFLRQACLFVKELWPNHSAWAVALIFEATLLALAMAVSLLSIVMVVRPRRRAKPYPRSLVVGLFYPDIEDKPEKAQEKILRDNVLRYALAVENNSKINTEISKWAISMTTSSLVVLFAICGLILTLTICYLRS